MEERELNILALDTSGPVAGCALMMDGRIVHSIAALHGRTHSESIMPMVDQALSESGITVLQLDCIAAVAGPGSFTGVRIGVCAAKGLAHAANVPCARVNALEALAMNFPGFRGTVAPLLDARRSQAYCAAFDLSEGTPRRLMEDRALPIEAFLEALPEEGDVLFLGDGLDAFREAARAALGSRALFAPAHLRDLKPESACALAALDPDRWMSAEKLTPIYLRAPQAERERARREGHV